MCFKCSEYTIFCDRSLGLKAALGCAKDEDIVIVLGKGREDFQEVKGEKIDYSDIKIIESFIE